MSATTVDNKRESPHDPNKRELVWFTILYFSVLHLSAVYGFYLFLFRARFLTVLWSLLLHSAGTIGMAAGAHRLWSHRSYKAKLPLRVLLVVFQTIGNQYSVITWSRNHRVHHKYSDTDADPHNANRGFFFSHIGWVLLRPHPEVRKRKREVDISDLKSDKLLMFQHKYYYILITLLCFYVPIAVPVYFFGETWSDSLHINSFRYMLSLNFTFLINSAAHLFGNRPYDKTIHPRENLTVAFLIGGEGWHNYHHAFPYDYKSSELGKYVTNGATVFLDLMAKIGWAYDLKSATPEMVANRARRTGDGSHAIWGWGDKDQPEEEKKMVDVSYSEENIVVGE